MIRNITKVSIKNVFLSIQSMSSLNHSQEIVLRNTRYIFLVVLSSIVFSSSLASAIDIDSCTVINAPGTYTLTASISNSSATNCIEITSSNVTFDGGSHLIDGVDASGTHGIHVYNASTALSNVVIRNATIRGWHVGIYFQKVDSSALENNYITDNQYCGIHLSNSDFNTVSNNTTSTNNFFGLILDAGSNENVISENSINNQGQGIQVGTFNSLADNNIIRNNRIGYNKYGIDVDSSDGLTIEDNSITYNWYGIYLDGSTDSTITRNIVTDNGYQDQYAGIFLSGSQNNLIYNNYFDNYQNFKFSGSGFPVYGNTWNTNKQVGINIAGGPYLGGNYWGDYHGFGSGPSIDCTDNDRDYICDNSYALEGGNIDNYPLKEFPDQDGDGVSDPDDNCKNISNPGQANSDGDDFGNACDNCWSIDNNDQADTNGNCSGPPYSVDPDCGDACEPSDTDGDGVPDVDDNCPTVPNSGQHDGDGDGDGDACDNCISIPNSDQSDWDSDEIGNACDNCWGTPNPDQEDVDGDCASNNQPYLINPYCGDACDECPNDPDKLFPWVCGCGVPETDTDNDGTPDCIDYCPNDPGKTEAGTCGCGVPDSDEDNDGHLYCNDNCPNRVNDQTDTDNDGLGDVCDNCPDVSNLNQEDSDADFVGDVCDNCSDVSNRDQANSDGDAWGDACDVDDDNDGVLDVSDKCPTTGNGLLAGTCVLDQHGKDCTRDWECGSGICSRNQEDTDGDGIGDACNDLSDTDGDEWSNSLDNCPDFYNHDQRDADNSGIGDICEFDLSIKNVEITQGIQNLDNSQFLVSGKNTWIRVHLDIGTAQTPLDPVTGRLRFTNQNGQQIPTYGPGAPAGFLFPVNDRIIAEVNPDRGDVNHTLNFFISEQWFWFEEPYITIQVINESPYDEIDEGDFFGNNYYGPVPWQFDFPGEKINITFVPVKVNDCTPTLADFYRAAEYVKKTYPISDIDLWTVDVLEFDEDPTVHNHSLMESLWWIEFWTDASADDMHYYGLVCDKATIGGTGPTSGTGGSSSVIDNNELAWGLMETSYPFGGATMAHELGHNYFSTFTGLGTEHHVPGCGNPEGINNSYPQYQDENGNNLHRASIGEYGFTWQLVYCSDSYHNSKDECEGAGETWYPDGYPGFKVFQPDRYYDFMSYCTNSEQWISPYTYLALIYELDYLTIIGTTSAFDTTKAITTGSGDQEYLIATGLIYENGTVELEPFFKRMLPIGTDDEPGTGPYSIELKDNSGLSCLQGTSN